MSVPDCEQEEYEALLQEYAKQDVPWKSDEEAAARWIVERDPDFFAKHQPFVGYVQFRYEGDFFGGQRLKALKVEICYHIGGMQTIPRDTDAEKDRDSRPWSFRAEDSSEPEPIARPIQPGGWVAPAKD